MTVHCAINQPGAEMNNTKVPTKEKADEDRYDGSKR